MSPDPIWGPIILQLILILINAFFAAGEIAIISLNDNKLRRQAEAGDQKAAKLLELSSSPNQFLSTIQVGITLAGFLGAAFAADNFAVHLVNWLISLGVSIPPNTLNFICVVLITLVLSYFTLVLGELVPKRITMQKPEQVANAIGPIIATLSKVFKPVVFVLSKSTNGLLRLLGMNPNQQNEDVTEEEIRMMMDIGEETGAIETNEKNMIDNIFEFNNIVAEDVMTHRTDVKAIWAEETQEDVIQTLMQTGLSRFPVYGKDIDDIIGILSARDFLFSTICNENKTVRELIREAYFVPDSVKADALFRDMQTNKVHMAIVVDEYGGMAGIVTIEDLLEEIVGNIYDEYDLPNDTEVQPLEANVWRVAGTAELEMLEELFGIPIPQIETFDTLGGLAFSELSAIPADGSTFNVTIGRLQIQVEKIVDHRVESAVVTILPQNEVDPQEEGEYNL